MLRLLIPLIILGTSAFAQTYDQDKIKSIHRLGTEDVVNSRKIWIKYVYDLKTKGIHLLDPGKYPLHAGLVKAEIAPQSSAKEIYDQSQFNKKRRYLFGSLTLSGRLGGRYDEQTQRHESMIDEPVTYDVIGQEHPAATTVGLLDKALKKYFASTGPAPIKYSPFARFLKHVSSNKSSLTAIGIDVDLSRYTSKEQVYAAGWAVGKLKKISAEELPQAMAEGRISLDDILWIDGSPPELPPAAGYILSEPSSPNSHPALLAQMLKAPLAYSASFEAPEGQYIYFRTRDAKDMTRYYAALPAFYVNSISAKQFKELKALKGNEPIGALALNARERKILESHKLGKSNIDGSAYGAKSAGMMKIQQAVDKAYTVKSLFIPIYWQKQYFATAKTKNGRSLQQFIDQKLKKIKNAPTPEVFLAMSEIRKAIMSAKLDNEMRFFAALLNRLMNFETKAKKIFLRSSSNAEDHPRFNGAGLYNSKSAKHDPDEVIQALKTVWASLYNYKAYWARQQFGIEENSVGMGVLAQGFLADVRSQGVVIASQSKRGGLDVTLTSFPGLLQVTNPPAGKLPEVISTNGEYQDLKQRTTELPVGQRVLGRLQVSEMSQQMKKLLAVWPAVLDVEWLQSGEQIKIVQSREVPQQEKFKRNYFVGADKVELRVSKIQGDSSDPSILRVRSQIKAQLSLNNTRKFDTSFVSAVSYTYKGKSYSLKKSDLNVRVINEEDRVHKLEIPLNNPDVPSLRIQIQFESRSQDLPELFDLSTMDLYVVYNARPFFPKNSARKLESYWMFIEQIDENQYNYDAVENYRVPLVMGGHSLTREFDGREEVITDKTNVRALTKEDREGRHQSLYFTKIEVENLYGHSFTVLPGANMVYTAEDHHVAPEMTIDLFSVKSLPSALRKRLETEGMRYLWALNIESDMGYAASVQLVSEDGKTAKEVARKELH